MSTTAPTRTRARREDRRPTWTFSRVTALCLTVGAIMTVASILLMPDFSGTSTDWLRNLAAAPAGASASALLFALAQLPLAVGAAGLLPILRRTAPVSGTLGALLVLVSAFGHSVFSGLNLTMVLMSREPALADTYAALVDEANGSALFMPFLAMGLLGTVLGFLTLAVATWRGRVGPRWLPFALVLFVATEFGLSGLSGWVAYSAALLFLLCLATLALEILRAGEDARRRSAV